MSSSEERQAKRARKKSWIDETKEPSIIARSHLIGAHPEDVGCRHPLHVGFVEAYLYEDVLPASMGSGVLIGRGG